MEGLFESPLPAVVIGGVTAAILIGGWLQTGHRWLLYLTAVVLLLTAGAVALERWVVTDREQVRETLFEIARLVENNQIEQALDYAWSGAPEVRQTARSELASYEFRSVDIKRNLQIRVSPRHVPPRAVAEFNVVVVLSDRFGMLSNQRIPRYVEVTLYRDDDGQWRVADYEHYDPRRGWTEEESL